MIRYLVCLYLVLMLSSHAHAIQSDLDGHVYDSNTNQLIYIEKHRVSSVDGRHVMTSNYLDIEDNQIATREVVFEDDLVTEYKLSQPQIEYQEFISRGDNKIEMTEIDRGQVRQTNIRETHLQQVVIDAGFSNFIVRNWDQLLSGSKLKFKFASPSQMKAINFEVKLASNVDGVLLFNMTVANPLIKLLIKPIKVGFNETTKELAYYKGISNLQDSQGKYYKVEIKYKKELNS